jgi:hypothetical protein
MPKRRQKLTYTKTPLYGMIQPLMKHQSLTLKRKMNLLDRYLLNLD